MKPLSRFIIVTGSIVCLLMPKKIARACGWYVNAGEYRFWILQPDLANIDDLSPFFLAAGYTYRDNWQNTPDDLYEKNVDEWHEEIKQQATKKDIHEVLYDFTPDTYYLRLESPEPKNSFIKYLQQPANRELLAYMDLCKRTEVMATDPDPWEEKPANDPKVAAILHLADSLHNKGKSAFVQLRSAFQMMRLHRYDRHREAVLKTYDSLIAPIKTNSYIKTAALYEKALYVPRPERDLLYAKIFEQGYRRKYCIAYMKSDSVYATLKLARTSGERSALLTMAALNRHDRCLRQIREIYAADPSWKELPFLLIREINKTEDWLLTGKVTEYPSVLRYRYDPVDESNYRHDLQYAKELYQFITTLIQQGRHEQKTMLHLFAAHMAMILQDYHASHRHLETVKRQPGLEENIRLQVRVNDLLLHVITNRFDAAAEKQMIDILNTPDSLLPVHSPDLLKDQLILFVAKKMLAKGEKVKGTMLLSRTRRSWGDIPHVGGYKSVYHVLEEIAGPNEYDAIIDILDKKNKTPFEKYVTDSPFATPLSYYEWYENHKDGEPTWDKDKLLDLKASWYIQRDELPKALEILEKLPDSLWSIYPYGNYVNSDPFSVNIYQGHKTELYEPVCNKLEVVKEMVRLQNMAKEKPEKAALCYLLLGNAHFNLTWHGKNWLMVKQYWSVNEDYGVSASPFNDIYYGCTRAREYYMKAGKLANNKKLASLCYFLAAECAYNFRMYRADALQGRGKASFGKRYAALLKQKGFDAGFYKELIKECDTYDKYRNEVRRLLP
jgi:hypothetical protein